jgi:hypothetical protein
MSVIFHVLKEEYERLIETEAAYSKAISEMPQGTPRIRQVRQREYLYLEYRDGQRVIHQYVGPRESPKAQQTLDKVAQRKRYQQLLKQTEAALKDVRKALRGKI